VITFPVAVAALALAGAGALAQPQSRRDRPEPPPPALNEDLDATQLRARLERMRAFSERMNERVTEGLAMLDDGASPGQVVRAIREPELGDTRIGRGVRDRIRAPGHRRDAPAPGPAQLERVRAFIAEHLPRLDAPLSKIERLGPGAGRGLLERLAPRIIEIIEINDRDPALGALKTDELRAGLDFVEATRRYRQALRAGIEDEGELDRLDFDLRDAAARRFDAQVALKKHEVRGLMERLASLSTALDELITERGERIDAQIDAAARLPVRERLDDQTADPDPAGDD